MRSKAVIGPDQHGGLYRMGQELLVIKHRAEIARMSESIRVYACLIAVGVVAIRRLKRPAIGAYLQDGPNPAPDAKRT